MNAIDSADMSTGAASRARIDVTAIFHVKIGIRNIVMPGARILKMVTRKLIAPSDDAMVMMSTPMIHRSVPCPCACAA